MPAIKYSELLKGDSLDFDDRYEINGFAKIHPNVRIEPYCIIESNVNIGENTIIGGFVQIRSNVTIGKNCRIGGHTTLESKDGYEILIGDNCRIGTHCNIPYNTVIEDDVFFGNGTIIANDRSIDWPPTKEFKPEFTRICKGVKIGLNCTLVGPVTIGSGSLIGAGSVVTKDVGKQDVVYGNPAKSKYH